MAIIRNNPPEHAPLGKVWKILRTLRGMDHEFIVPDDIDIFASLIVVAQSLPADKEQWTART